MFRLVPDSSADRDLGNMVQFFNNLGVRLGTAEREVVHESVLQGFQDNFRGERDAQGRWPPLTETTRALRAMGGYAAAHPILYQDGDYYRSLTDPGNGDHFMQSYASSNLFAMEVGSESKLFPWHEGGTEHMPARSVTDLTKASERRIGNDVTAMLNRLMAREGL